MATITAIRFPRGITPMFALFCVTIIYCFTWQMQLQMQKQMVPDKNCIKKDRIIAIREAIKDLNEKHNIRVFPRNGFLLGVIRHRGFLPNEKVDADLGAIFTDLYNVMSKEMKRTVHVGDFKFKFQKTERNWVSWKGKNPISGERYPFFGVGISRPDFSHKAYAFYPYLEGKFFYPRCNIRLFNHRGNAKEMQRWNEEAANYRLVDTNELVDETNFKKGKQIGAVFNMTSGSDCMVEKEFYFTTILVPCDYEEILQAHYGKNWHRVEKRSSWESKQLSEEQNANFLKNGPLPICEQ